MAYEIKIPSVGESITSATLGAWRKGDGEYVNAGDVILDIETDKISTELTADKAGVLRHRAAEGEELEIGAIVAVVEEGDAPAGDAGADQAAAPSPPQAEEAPPVAAAASEGGTVKATPVARKIAGQEGISVDSLTGTGIGGKVTKADVLGAIQGSASAAPAAAPSQEPAASAPAVNAQGRTTRKKMSPLRRKIAQHLVNAQQDAALLTTFNEVDMSAVMNLRKKLQDGFVARHGVKLGFMSFFVKAVVDALQAVPSINASIEGDEIVENHYYDVGVAVGTEKGLIVPVLRDCDTKSFAEIEKDIISYAGKAREGKVQLTDLQGGVFTITNGGIYGSMLSTPILNPPQSGILGMHNIIERPVAVNGQVVIRPMMYLALTYDHRLVDGKEAVTFLVRIKDVIENPEKLLVGA